MKKSELPNIQEGEGSEHSPLYDDIIETDAHPLTDPILSRGNYLPSATSVPFAVYCDPEFARKEIEHVWKTAWQFACREEEIPKPGDRLPYDVGPLSYLIVRTDSGEIKAFLNACRHRGTRLCSARGKAKSIRCPFHGWNWNTDGTVKSIPARWDFPDAEDEQLKLKQVKVSTWQGCVFINPDIEAGPLEDALGVLDDHFKNFDMENRFIAVHTRKKVRANWKLTLEAFLETYHVMETHGQISSFSGDLNARYDIYDDGKAKIGRFLAPLGVPSVLRGDKVSQDNAAKQLFESMIAGMDASVPQPDFARHDTFGRAEIAQWRRDHIKDAFGVDRSDLSDAEMLDGIQYHMFPNFVPWLGEGLSVMYQFLPYGNGAEESIMEIRLLLPLPQGAPRPPPADIVEIDFDESFNKQPEWGELCEVFDQDMNNLPLIQKGVWTAFSDDAEASTRLAKYQEQRCAALYEYVMEKIGSS